MLMALARPSGNMHVGEGRLAAGPGVAVGYSDSRGFLQSSDVLQVRKVLEHVHEGSLAGPWVAEHILDTLGHEHTSQGLFAGHSGHGFLQLGAVPMTRR